VNEALRDYSLNIIVFGRKTTSTKKMPTMGSSFRSPFKDQVNCKKDDGK